MPLLVHPPLSVNNHLGGTGTTTGRLKTRAHDISPNCVGKRVKGLTFIVASCESIKKQFYSSRPSWEKSLCLMLSANSTIAAFTASAFVMNRPLFIMASSFLSVYLSIVNSKRILSSWFIFLPLNLGYRTITRTNIYIFIYGFYYGLKTVKFIKREVAIRNCAKIRTY